MLIKESDLIRKLARNISTQIRNLFFSNFMLADFDYMSYLLVSIEPRLMILLSINIVSKDIKETFSIFKNKENLIRTSSHEKIDS